MTGNEPLVITVDQARADAWFGELLRRGQDLSRLMAEIGEHLTETTQKRFSTGIAPDGVAWAKLKDGSGRSPLLQTGRLRDEIFPSSGDNWAEISATARQARWHQEGTEPYVILPKTGKALSWPGGPGPRAKVNHPGLEARPFIGLSAQDARDIDVIASAYLDLEGFAAAGA